MTELSSALISAQRVLEVTPDGVLVEVALRSDGSAPTTAVVLLVSGFRYFRATERRFADTI